MRISHGHLDGLVPRVKAGSFKAQELGDKMKKQLKVLLLFPLVTALMAVAQSGAVIPKGERAMPIRRVA